jgi:hypothetical protein
MFSILPTMRSNSHTVEPRECPVELWRIAGAWAVLFASWLKRYNVRSLTKHWNCQHAQGPTERFLNL